MALPICARKFCRGRVVSAQAMAYPPSTETMQKMVIRQTRDTVMPIMRGTNRTSRGSTPWSSRASISRKTVMYPVSIVTAVADRRMTTRAVTRGPNSRMSRATVIFPRSCWAAMPANCRIIMLPRSSEMGMTIHRASTAVK